MMTTGQFKLVARSGHSGTGGQVLLAGWSVGGGGYIRDATSLHGDTILLELKDEVDRAILSLAIKK